MATFAFASSQQLIPPSYVIEIPTVFFPHKTSYFSSSSPHLSSFSSSSSSSSGCCGRLLLLWHRSRIRFATAVTSAHAATVWRICELSPMIACDIFKTLRDYCNNFLHILFPPLADDIKLFSSLLIREEQEAMKPKRMTTPDRPTIIFVF